jgi:uncharacterized protein
MRLEQSFTVTAPLDAVWAALIDVERVAPCLPGAQITAKGEGGVYEGQFTVKLGPTTAAYNGALKMEELDEAAHIAVMSARGTDRRGQGGASATIRSTVRPDGDGTRVDVLTDFSITGRLARFGRGGMIEDVSKRLLREFASCLQATIDAAPPADGAAAPAAEPDVEASVAPAPDLEAPEALSPAAAPAAASAVAPLEPGTGAPPRPAEHARPSEPSEPSEPPQAAAKPLNAIELVLGVLKDRLVALWKSVGTWLRARLHRPS